MERTKFNDSNIKASYATLYNVSQHIPGSKNIADSYCDVLSPSYEDDWPELIQEMDTKSKTVINTWLIKEDPKIIIEVLRPLQLTKKSRSKLAILKALAIPRFKFYFDSDFKAIPNSFAMPSPFFVVDNKDKNTTTSKTIIRKCGNTTLEIDGPILHAKDAQLTHALIFLMRRNLVKVTEDGVHFTTNEVEIAKVLLKRNPYDPIIKQNIKEGLKRLRGCVLTLVNDKGQWMIGGILNKATKIDEHEVKIILDIDFINLLELGYIELDPKIHFKLSPATANVYRYLMRQKSFNTFGTLSKRHNRKLYETAGMGGIDPDRHTDAYIRFVLKAKLQDLKNKGLLHDFTVNKNYTWVWNDTDKAGEVKPVEELKTLKTKPLEIKSKQTKPTICPHGHTFGVDCNEFKEDCTKCEVWDECEEWGDN